MPAITSLDLSNAKLDVDHIAAIATSTSPTATDRMGNTKDTMSGAIYSIKAFNNRGAWQASTIYAVKDLVSVSGTWYVAVVPHTSSATFVADTESYWRVYQGALSSDVDLVRSDLAAASGAGMLGWIQSGAGAASRFTQDKLRESVSVKDFGAVGDGVANDTAAFIAALAVGASRIYIPNGTYLIASTLSIPTNVVLYGDGSGSIVKCSASMAQLFNCAAAGSQKFDNFSIDGNSMAGTNGININNDFVNITRMGFSGFSSAVYVTGSAQAFNVSEHCFFLNNSFCVFINNDGRNSTIIGNHMQGGTGIWVRQVAQQCEGLRIIGNIILPNVTASANSGHGILIECGLELLIMGNIIDNVDKSGIQLSATGANAIAYCKIIGNWTGNDGGTASAEGLLMYGNVSNVDVTNNTFASAKLYGMHIGVATYAAPDRINVTGNSFLANIGGDIKVELAGSILVSGNTFSHAVNSYREEVNTITGTVTNNNFTGSIPSPRSTASRYRFNRGFITEAKGTGTVPSGSTNSANINHGLSVTPSEKDFTITPMGPMATNDTGNWLVSALDTTKFNVFVRNNPGAAGFNFGWSVEYTGQ